MNRITHFQFELWQTIRLSRIKPIFLHSKRPDLTLLELHGGHHQTKHKQGNFLTYMSRFEYVFVSDVDGGNVQSVVGLNNGVSGSNFAVSILVFPDDPWKGSQRATDVPNGLGLKRTHQRVPSFYRRTRETSYKPETPPSPRGTFPWKFQLTFSSYWKLGSSLEQSVRLRVRADRVCACERMQVAKNIMGAGSVRRFPADVLVAYNNGLNELVPDFSGERVFIFE